MFKNYLKGIQGITCYPELSLLVFFLFFIILTVWVIRVDKKGLEKISEMPLESSDSENNQSAI